MGLPLYGYVSQSTATTLTGIALPPAGFDVKQYRERVLQLPSRNIAPSCPLVLEKFEEEPNFLNGEHRRVKTVKPIDGSDAKDAAVGDLSSYYGQQIPFNQIVALGALTKTSNGTYVQANGYTEGGLVHCFHGHCGLTMRRAIRGIGWDDCSDTPVSTASILLVDQDRANEPLVPV